MSLVVSGLLVTFGTGIFSSHLVGYPGTSLGLLALTLWDIPGRP